MASSSLFLMPVPLIIGHTATVLRLSHDRISETSPVTSTPGYATRRRTLSEGDLPTIESRTFGNAGRTKGNTLFTKNSAATSLGGSS